MKDVVMIIMAVCIVVMFTEINLYQTKCAEYEKQLDDVNNWDLAFLDATDSLVYYGGKMQDTTANKEYANGFMRNADKIFELCKSN